MNSGSEVRSQQVFDKTYSLNRLQNEPIPNNNNATNETK